ncbi:MAG: AAA family ATPase, partial [Gammaproteobacteria bacterium]|nr:AAA family ATPase [Gammaproteobacteria bacterium]
MYLEHFGFRELPFSLTPDTEFFFGSAHHRDVLNVLRVALRSGEGFIVVSAEIGLGKTLLCRLLLRELDDEFTTAFIPDPQLSPRALRIALAEELGVNLRSSWTEEQVLRHVQRELMSQARSGRKVLLLLDEAHQLPPQTLESVRLLTNLETEKSKLLQVVLFGQPELDRRLLHPTLRQLRQRVGFHCTLQPLDRDATAVYIAHRVNVAGARIDPLFSPSAVRRIHNASGGTPSVINVLWHKSLMAAFGSGDYVVNRHHAQRAVADSLIMVGAADSGHVPWWHVNRWVG